MAEVRCIYNMRAPLGLIADSPSHRHCPSSGSIDKRAALPPEVVVSTDITRPVAKR